METFACWEELVRAAAIDSQFVNGFVGAGVVGGGFWVGLCEGVLEGDALASTHEQTPDDTNKTESHSPPSEICPPRASSQKT
eukprot:11213372-Ditylum_brightwellii.AAC.2